MLVVNDKSFETEVLARSKEIPVLVDFWAPWCGPCRVLGPTLEKLAAENEGRWKLVKLNTDENPELSQRYQIRGIPAVKLFVDGEVADEFTGALPEHVLRTWLRKAIPSAIDAKLAEARKALGEGEVDRGIALLETVIEQEPSSEEARVLLANLIIFDDPKRADDLVAGAMPAHPGLLQMAEAVKTISRLLQIADRPEALPDDPIKERYLEAVQHVAQRDFDAAMDAFIDVITRNRRYDEDGARKACIALFSLLGEQHPAVRNNRRRFDMALY